MRAACSSSVPAFSTHWTPPGDAFGAVAQRAIEVLTSQPAAHVLLGDLNVYRIDAWNPAVPCTGSNAAARIETIERMEAAGYADAWKATQGGEGWTGMATRAGCGVPNGNLYKRIDYVYTTGLRAIATTRLARAAPGADAPSDHVILVAQLARQ
jgi:endonuclease/exonuclease/phosphatase family metal-dependent hydrolase